MKKGDFVTIDYIGRIKESGELFDTTKENVAKEEDAHNPNVNYEPIPIIVGSDMVIEGLDKQLEDMNVGEKKQFTIEPDKGFGQRKGELIKTFSEKKFKDQDMNPYPGMRVDLNGRMAKVLSVNSGRVRVDLNHPLAGRSLDYQVKIIEKIEDLEKKIKKAGKYFFGQDIEIELDNENNAIINVEEEIPEEVKTDFEEKIKEYTNVNDIKFEAKEDKTDEK